MKHQKLHKSLVEAVKNGLIEIFLDQKKADKAVAGILKSNSKWGSRDRSFIAENIYDIVRNWRLIKYCAGFENHKLDTDDDFYKAIGTWLLIQEYDISALEYLVNEEQINLSENLEKANSDLKVKYSMPDWLHEKGLEQYGEQWESIVIASHTKAKVFLRANTSIITKNKLQEVLKKQNIESEPVDGVENALMLKNRANVFGLDAYNKGFFEVQDAGSQIIAEFLDVKPGMKVIDACAGAGGKSLQLATIMENKGKIIALDIEDFKLIELEKRAKRNKIRIIKTELISNDTLQSLELTADRLLLDAPCSGLGVLKRNPDAKWKIKPEFVEKITKTQKEILNNYARMLKKGGKMVYATCSILKEENQMQVQDFLNNNAGYKLIEDKMILPTLEGFDGFYMALIEKLK